VATDGDAFAIRRRRGQAPLQFDGNVYDAAFHLLRKALSDHEAPFQSGWQAISFGEARWKMSVIFGVPTPEFVAVMTGKCVAAAIAIIVIVSMFTLVIPPMSVAVVPSTILVVAPAMIFVVLVFVSKSCVSGKHKKAENDDRKAFSSIQSLLRLKIWLGL